MTDATRTADVPGDAPVRPRKLSPEVRRSLARVKAGTASETDLQRVVTQYAKDHGWLVHQQPRGKGRDGRWMTVKWGHPGWPDFTAARDGRLVIAELKAKAGTVSPEQQAWLDRLALVPGVVVHVWRPYQWAEIRRVLR